MTPVKELPLDDTEKVRTIRTSNDLAEAIANGTLDYKNSVLALHISEFYKARPHTKDHKNLANIIKRKIGGWSQLHRAERESTIRSILETHGWPSDVSCFGLSKMQVIRILENAKLFKAFEASDLPLTVPLEPKKDVNEVVSLPMSQSLSQGDS